MELLIATKNPGKIEELKDLLSYLPVVLRSLNEFGDIPEPDETGTDFAENAALKANYYALKTKIWALADDSGLEVEALNGAPGVFSARYGGKNSSYTEKINRLLNEINEKKDDNRRARFVCVMAIADENGNIKYLSEGICEGKIHSQASGNGGFGYDPIFIPEGYSETFGELPAQIKQKISHRSRAIKKIIGILRGITAL